jgi:hypothetical protein
MKSKVREPSNTFDNYGAGGGRKLGGHEVLFVLTVYECDRNPLSTGHVSLPLFNVRHNLVPGQRVHAIRSQVPLDLER